MTQPFRSSSAASLIVLASMMAGCAAHPSHVAAASSAGKADPQVGLATRAMAALNANDAPAAIDFAERAVANTPTDAGFRALLGSAYFAGGRFHSAEAAYKDSLTIDENQPQVILKLALVEIAQGKNVEAVASLNAGRAVLDPSDYGLALALAGHPAAAVTILQTAARQQSADATVRQNLALAYALAGDWSNARIIAAQDVPANQLDDRIQQWMQFAKPAHASDQVASLVGVKPAAVDAGQPVQLALNRASPAATQVAASVAAPPRPAQPNIVVEASVPASIPAPVHAVAPAPPPARPTIATLAQSAVSEAKAVIASFTNSAPVAPKPAALRRAAVQTAAARRGNSTAVVQLGAYGSPQRVLTAWDGQARKYGALKAYLPMSARFSSAKGTFYRLSVRGFDSVGQANALCSSLRHQGGTCFVRNLAGDMPVQYASR
jgi:Flp pilus assembly protein TadD